MHKMKIPLLSEPCLFSERLPLLKAFQAETEFIDREWLSQVVIGADLDGLNRIIKRAIAGNKHDLEQWVLVLKR